MKATKSERGFVHVTHPTYCPAGEGRLIAESSAIGDYEDAMSRPGSSFLWVGENHHLDREEVAELAQRMLDWLREGRLQTP